MSIDYDSGWREEEPIDALTKQVDRLTVALADCQQLAKGEQSLLDSLREQAAEMQAAEIQALQDALALTAVELAEVRKERDRAVERLERAGIL